MTTLFIRFTARTFRKLLSVYVFSYFPFGFEGRILDLTVSLPDNCLSFNVGKVSLKSHSILNKCPKIHDPLYPYIPKIPFTCKTLNSIPFKKCTISLYPKIPLKGLATEGKLTGCSYKPEDHWSCIANLRT